MRWNAAPGMRQAARMGYILYGDIGSGSAMAEMALAEAGQAAEWREVTLEGDHQLRAEYLAVNPMGRMPTLLLPDGTVMTESLAILASIADLHPQAGLLPAPGETARAVALRWMTLMAAEAYPHVTPLRLPRPLHAPIPPPRPASRRARWRCTARC
jgi:GST-like protein